MKKQEANKVVNPLFEKRLTNFGFGQDFQLKRDLTHFVRWPCYIQLQLLPTINQFTQGLDHQTATQLLKVAHKYSPETKQEKNQKLLAGAKKKFPSRGMSPLRAMIALDVDPIEMVVFWPALCHKMEDLHTVGFTEVNLEDRGALAKLVEAIRTNYSDRYGKIHHQ
ncbi:60s ribosomal protein l7a-like [Lynx pardinus]|uniref:60S ribosomal protein L7a n=1 Tax=Lynx pardinus TaxID=191816 RepID=A0A485MNX4_LYNPA|nr:60s ribosomal protein l7a-like [Lynx pardinus]